LKAAHEAEVVADVVADVAPDQEGGLSDIDEVLEWPLQAIGHDQHDELDVGIEEGDGAVAGELKWGLAGFEEEADDPLEEGGEGGGSGGVLKGGVGDGQDDG
jgi:hypothetical protein